MPDTGLQHAVSPRAGDAVWLLCLLVRVALQEEGAATWGEEEGGWLLQLPAIHQQSLQVWGGVKQGLCY